MQEMSKAQGDWVMGGGYQDEGRGGRSGQETSEKHEAELTKVQMMLD